LALITVATEKNSEISTKFRPRARLMELLGEQLIKDHRLALFELVKNAYDADATEVLLRFGGLRSDDPWIGIRDNGSGMSIETVLLHWMEPASDHKASARRNGIRTPIYKRLPVGEKGVGRFAVHKLGKTIRMVTKTEDSDSEVVVEIDWEKFSANQYLDEAPVKIVQKTPTTFSTPNDHGTMVRIGGLKQTWTRGDIRRLYRNVMAMTSVPGLTNLGLVDGDALTSDSFEVKFKLDNELASWLDGLFLAKDADQFAMYRFEFELTNEGFSWRYQFTPMRAIEVDSGGDVHTRDAGEDETKGFEFFKFAPPGEGGWRQRNDRPKGFSLSDIGIGPIRGRILGFDLDKEIVARYVPDGAGLTKFLEEHGGVRVYRDGLRVFDYGEPGNDWLGLDLRRINRPTKRLSNNILIGEVHLDLEESVSLKEKTNREGFVDNPAYREFHYAVLCAITYFEAARNEDKARLRALTSTPETLVDAADDSAFIRPEDAISTLRTRAEKSGEGRALIPLIDRVQTAYEETRDALLSAVGAGLGLATVFHEIERGVRGLDRAIELGEPVEKISKMSVALVELLTGSSTFLRTQNSEKISARTLLDQALFSCKSRFKFHNIQFLNGFTLRPELDFEIDGTRRMLVAAIVNLIDNSIYWSRMSRKDPSEVGTIWIGPATELEGPAIVIADSGEGFIDDPSMAIRPFHTRRTDGMGIGLYFTDMVMKSHGGRLAFPRNAEIDVPKKCTGAIVALVFKQKT
jgi:anti-sigma regulatory factor (Ser/Thr protein kinase)